MYGLAMKKTRLALLLTICVYQSESLRITKKSITVRGLHKVSGGDRRRLGFCAFAVVRPVLHSKVFSLFPMPSNLVWLQIATGICGIASAIVGGVFLSFSDFLMRSLDLAGEPAGSDVMKSINVQVFHYVFIPSFMALVPATIGTAVAGSIKRGPWSKYLIASSVIYCFGSFLLTGMGNVPMNNKLAALSGPEQSAYWTQTYLPKWTLYNTIRTIACIASAISSLIAYGQLAAAASGGSPLLSGGSTSYTSVHSAL